MSGPGTIYSRKPKGKKLTFMLGGPTFEEARRMIQWDRVDPTKQVIIWRSFEGGEDHVLTPPQKNPVKRGAKSRAKYTHKKVGKAKLDKRSIRTKRVSKHTAVVVGCPMGHYNAKRKRCKVATKVSSVLTKKRTHKAAKKNPEFGRSLKKPYRVIAKVRNRMFYLHATHHGWKLYDVAKGAWSSASEAMATHRAQHMALAFPKYQWGVLRP